MKYKHISHRAYEVGCQFVELASLFGSRPGDICLIASDVASYQNTSRQNAHRVLKWMEEKGFVVSELVKTDNGGFHVRQYWLADEAPIPTRAFEGVVVDAS